MGFDVNSFLKKYQISQELICSICDGVMDNPLLIEKCEHMFCGKCIREWQATSQTCPMDRENIVGIQLKKPPRPLLNMLNELSRNCRFGCGSTVTLGNTEAHALICEANPDALLECKQKCGAMVKRAELELHNCIKYLKDIIKDSVTKAASEKRELQQQLDEAKKELAKKKLIPFRYDKFT